MRDKRRERAVSGVVKLEVALDAVFDEGEALAGEVHGKIFGRGGGGNAPDSLKPLFAGDEQGAIKMEVVCHDAYAPLSESGHELSG